MNVPPPPPDIGQTTGITPNASGAGPSALAPQQAQTPAPDQQQTVATLRHFQAILKELQTLMEIPSIGKADIKSQIIEGTTKLVADRILAPAEAVMTLAKVPSDPAQQKQWVQEQFVQSLQAQATILDHHRAAYAGMEDMGESPSSDDHMATMSNMMQQHYGGSNG